MELPKFYFIVKIAGQEIPFQEVSGTDSEAQTIEYRHGNRPERSMGRIPGVKKSRTVILRKGRFKDGNTFRDWANQIKMNTFERQTVTISLLHQMGNDAIVWTLQNARPTKISGTGLKAGSNEITVETLEIAHEGISIANL